MAICVSELGGGGVHILANLNLSNSRPPPPSMISFRHGTEQNNSSIITWNPSLPLGYYIICERSNWLVSYHPQMVQAAIPFMRGAAYSYEVFHVRCTWYITQVTHSIQVSLKSFDCPKYIECVETAILTNTTLWTQIWGTLTIQVPYKYLWCDSLSKRNKKWTIKYNTQPIDRIDFLLSSVFRFRVHKDKMRIEYLL